MLLIQNSWIYFCNTQTIKSRLENNEEIWDLLWHHCCYNGSGCLYFKVRKLKVILNKTNACEYKAFKLNFNAFFYHEKKILKKKKKKTKISSWVSLSGCPSISMQEGHKSAITQERESQTRRPNPSRSEKLNQSCCKSQNTGERQWKQPAEKPTAPL